jgi:L-threonylcarbamoyladenylate synthase
VKNAATRNSPGLRHRHYQPLARVVLWDSSTSIDVILSSAPDKRIGWIGTGQIEAGGIVAMHRCSSIDEYAAKLFQFFRHCDELQVDLILCQAVPKYGLGLALMDRIERAAATV